MTLTKSQTAAQDAFTSFMEGEDTSFLLDGGAGVGKTFTTAAILRDVVGSVGRILYIFPTHKALRVGVSKLEDAGVAFVVKPTAEQLETLPLNIIVVDTLAGALGIRPMDFTLNDKGEVEEVFARSSLVASRLSKVAPALLVMDESSMCSAQDLKVVVECLEETGSKLLAIGDAGQLPPVKKVAIDFEKAFDVRVTLRDVIRQKAGSAVIDLAWAIRDGKAIDGVQGKDLVKHDDVVADYLKAVKLPVVDESKRTVFLAYKNVTVNAVQEAACQKVYGHSASTFQAGEYAVATRPGYRAVQTMFKGRPSKFPKLVIEVQNADLLRIESISTERDALLGASVEVCRVNVQGEGRTFKTHLLSEQELADPTHPFNVKSAEMYKVAVDLDAQCKATKAARGSSLDKQRKVAFAQYKELQNSVLGAAHLFAQTTHKSQGSTYGEVWMATAEILKHSSRALYVASTRTSGKLHW